MSELLSEVIDIIVLLKNKNREPAIVLRVMQTTFSLIDYQMLRHVNYHLLTRLYSVCFDCCQIDPTIQNISVSALCSLTEIVFAQGELSDASILLQQFLEYLLRKKKFNWIL